MNKTIRADAYSKR